MEAAPRPGRTTDTRIVALDGSARTMRYDDVVTEEPLEIRFNGASLAVTMRTPGHDFELAAGFVTSESIVALDQPLAVTYCLDGSLDDEQRYNVVSIASSDALGSQERFERHFTINSSCGVCGRAQLDDLLARITPLDDATAISADLLYRLPSEMREAQRVFAKTGALHAAALFDASGALLCIREDVGRHNAVDKVVGWGKLERRLPFERTVLMVSGRAGYEIVQKAAVARIPIVAAVSAPSSLAVQFAESFGITLAGFVRGTRANIYSAPERVSDIR